jgi:uroporphyrinogen-III synthase
MSCDARAVATLVVTRPHPPSPALRRAAEQAGLRVVWLPLLEIRFRSDAAVLDAVGRMAEFDLVVVTSANALRALAQAADRMGRSLASVAPQVVAVGRASAEEAKALGLSATFPPTGKTAEDLLSWLSTQPALAPPRRILLPRGQLADDSLVRGLVDAGYDVVPVVCYDTVEAKVDLSQWEGALSGTRPCVVALYSPSAVRALAKVKSAVDRIHADVRVAVVGPTTARAARSAGLSVWCTADQPSDESLVASIARRLRERPELQ